MQSQFEDYGNHPKKDLFAANKISLSRPFRCNVAPHGADSELCRQNESLRDTNSYQIGTRVIVLQGPDV